MKQKRRVARIPMKRAVLEIEPGELDPAGQARSRLVHLILGIPEAPGRPPLASVNRQATGTGEPDLSREPSNQQQKKTRKKQPRKSRKKAR